MILKKWKNNQFYIILRIIFIVSFLSKTIVYNYQDTFKSRDKIKDIYLHGS